MQIVDANVLLYAVDSESAHHMEAARWVDGSATRSETVGLAWLVLLAFLRISTRASVFARPLTIAEAAGAVRGWLARPSSVVVAPTSRHLDVVLGLLAEAGTAGNLVPDAHLAALAVEHDAELVSYDRDFGRFAGVRHRVPG